jgi:hypothetical protein
MTAIGEKLEMDNRLKEEARTELYRAAISCAHDIDAEQVILYRDSKKPGNALAQLADRLDAAHTSLLSSQSSQAAPMPDGMPESQEPKYGIRDNRLYNRASGEFIPLDEPVFIFRARDTFAANALLGYVVDLTRINTKAMNQHVDIVMQRLRQFQRFAIEHSDRMKQPDSALASTADRPTEEGGQA